MKNKIFPSSVLLLTLLFNKSTAQSYNYNQNGRDWTGACATGLYQSPIDLPSS